jgi:hypothetical protein
LTWVFDHPVPADRAHAWWWRRDADTWDLLGRPQVTVTYLRRVFEAPEQLFTQFRADQIGQGFVFIFDGACTNHMAALWNDRVPLPEREMTIRALIPLYEKGFARLCPDRKDAKANENAEYACYMLWEHAASPGSPVDECCLDVMQAALRLPNVSCRNSALLGLWLWQRRCPERVRRIAVEFLEPNPWTASEMREQAEKLVR